MEGESGQGQGGTAQRGHCRAEITGNVYASELREELCSCYETEAKADVVLEDVTRLRMKVGRGAWSSAART